MSNIIPFEFEGVPVRVVDQNGDPWWVLADVCRVLEIVNPSHAASRLDDNVKSTLVSDEGGPDRIIVSEGGLYDLLDGSRKPVAKRLRRWKNHEVMPTLRKTGRYVMPGADQPASLDFVKQVWEEQTKLIGIQFATQNATLVRIDTKVDELRAEVSDLRSRIKPPKAPFGDNDWELWRQVCQANGGLDPSGSGKPVLDKNGNWLPGIVADHHNREKGGYMNGWPVPSDINEKLKDDDYRDARRHRVKWFKDEINRLFPNGPRSWVGRRRGSQTINQAGQASWL